MFLEKFIFYYLIFIIRCSMILLVTAPVAQWIEHRPPEPGAEVRFLSGALLYLKESIMKYNIYINNEKISSNHRMAVNEYIKRLSPYCSITINESKNPPFSNTSGRSDHGSWFLEKGISTHSSTDFSKNIEKCQLSGISTINIYVGYSNVDLTVSDESNNESSIMRLSLSATDLSIQTVTVLLLEQLYRGYTIIHGKTYHK